MSIIEFEVFRNLLSVFDCMCARVYCQGQSEGHLHPVLTMSDGVMMSFLLIWSQTVRPSADL